MSLGVPSYGGEESQMQRVPHVPPPTLPARRSPRQARTQLTKGEAAASQLQGIFLKDAVCPSHVKIPCR